MYSLLSRWSLMIATIMSKIYTTGTLTLIGNLAVTQRSNNSASQLATTAKYMSSTNLTDFPDAILNVGLSDGITLSAGTAVTWNGAYQTLTCHSSVPTTSIQWVAECEPRGCLFQSIKVTDQQYKMRFVADPGWNNSGAACRVYKVAHTSNTYYIPIMVREPPALEITPPTVDFYLQYIAEYVVLRCRIIDNPYVKVSSLRWSARDSNGSAISNLTLNVTYDSLETRLSLSRSDIAIVRRVRCEGAVGAEAPYLRLAAMADIRTHASPQLRITSAHQVFIIGRQVTLSCQTDDAVIGGLRWAFSCTACQWETEQSTNGTHLAGARIYLTFTASSAWNGVRIGCHIASHPQFITYLTVIAKRIPLLSLSPPTLMVYDEFPSSVRCVAKYSQALGEIEPPTYVTDIRLFVKLNGDETQAELRELSHNVSIDPQGFSLTFVPTPAWHRREIGCHLWTCDSSEIAETAQTVVVRVYSAPVITVVPRSLSLGLGANATLMCSADGYVIGDLHWTVDCADCSYRSQVLDLTATSARLRLIFIATTSWDGVTVQCGLQNTAELPAAWATVEVIGIQSVMMIQWIWLSLGLTGIVVLLATFTLRRREELARKSRKTLTRSSSSGRKDNSSSIYVDGSEQPVVMVTCASTLNTEHPGRPEESTVIDAVTAANQFAVTITKNRSEITSRQRSIATGNARHVARSFTVRDKKTEGQLA